MIEGLTLPDRAESMGDALGTGDTVDPLVLDLLEWLAPRPRPYAEVMDAWRTSCPRLPVWEEANARGFVVRLHREGIGSLVGLSESGRLHLSARRPQHPPGEALSKTGRHAPTQSHK